MVFSFMYKHLYKQTPFKSVFPLSERIFSERSHSTNLDYYIMEKIDLQELSDSSDCETGLKDRFTQLSAYSAIIIEPFRKVRKR
jgi:hypothetical protein